MVKDWITLAGKSEEQKDSTWRRHRRGGKKGEKLSTERLKRPLGQNLGSCHEEIKKWKPTHKKCTDLSHKKRKGRETAGRVGERSHRKWFSSYTLE